MQNIPLALAKPGMVLAKNVANPNSPGGAPICGTGISLTDSLIDRLVRMGVQSVIVAGHPVVIEGESTLEEMLGKLEKRFKRVAQDSLMMSVKEIFRKPLIRSMEG